MAIHSIRVSEDPPVCGVLKKGLEIMTANNSFPYAQELSLKPEGGTKKGLLTQEALNEAIFGYNAANPTNPYSGDAGELHKSLQRGHSPVKVSSAATSNDPDHYTSVYEITSAQKAMGCSPDK